MSKFEKDYEFTTTMYYDDIQIEVAARIVNVVDRGSKGTRYVVAIDNMMNNTFRQIEHIDGEKALLKLMTVKVES
ncbi:hypothetical protein [Metabacillus fastidiosus]|uniref:hypothetical protein n=1 Tax=Metabacillus fastidiosus TaxID=1458 RepID=UPI003D2AAF51